MSQTAEISGILAGIALGKGPTGGAVPWYADAEQDEMAGAAAFVVPPNRDVAFGRNVVDSTGMHGRGVSASSLIQRSANDRTCVFKAFVPGRRVTASTGLATEPAADDAPMIPSARIPTI